MLKASRFPRLACLAVIMAICGSATQVSAQTLQVSTTVEAASCSFGTFTNVSFGTTIPAGVVGTEIPGSGAIKITCTANITDAKIKMLGASGNRVMFKDGNNANAEQLIYQLRKPNSAGAATTAAWGDSGTSVLTKNLTTTETTINVHAAIVVGETAIAGTTYSDSVTVEVEI